MDRQIMVTVSARVSPRTRRLAETAAELKGMTLSHFVANAIEEATRSELLTADDETRQRS